MKIVDSMALMTVANHGFGQPWCAALLGEGVGAEFSTIHFEPVTVRGAVVPVLARQDDGVVKTAQSSPETKRLLSERETAVLRRLSLGESNKEAARELQISPSTVRTHVESIFRKLGCSSRTAASLKGMDLGLI